MSEKILKSRIIHKHAVESDWLKATNFIPKQGEIIIYDIDSTHTYERVKVGDGKTVVSSLPFIDDNKVDKVAGKGLSTNDYTTEDKNKLANLATLVGDTAVATQISNAIDKMELITVADIDAICGASAMITFTIDGVSYQVTNGTTWYEWANANGWNCSSETDGVWDSNYDCRILDSNGMDMSGGDVIIAGAAYTASN